jgi:hypothetical protein
MFDINVETPLALTQAALLVPPGHGGKKTHISTLLRWILTGAKAPNGATVRLEAVRLGGRWLTSREALQRFAERLTPKFDDEPADVPRSPAARQRANRRAERVLERAGI